MARTRSIVPITLRPRLSTLSGLGMSKAAGWPLFATPVKERPALSPGGWLHWLSFNVVFQLGMVCIHSAQLVTLPLHLLATTLPLWDSLATWSKGLFGQLLVFISQIFAPTKLRITVDPDDDELDLDKIVVRDENGTPVGIDLPQRMVIISNHQVRCLVRD